MPAVLIVEQVLNGLQSGVRLFLMATGLTLVATLLVEKSLGEMRQVMDHAVILERGRSVWQGMPDEITEDVAGRFPGV